MMDYKLSVLLPVTVVHAEEHDKLRLLTYLSQEMDKEKLTLTKTPLLDPGNEVYKIFQNDQPEPSGFAITSDYSRMSNTKEIIFYSPESIEDTELYIEILKQTINVLSEDHEINYIILKIRDSLKTLAIAAETVGFMKDGIFISNQFLEGEFTFYSVYQYKLS